MDPLAARRIFRRPPPQKVLPTLTAAEHDALASLTLCKVPLEVIYRIALPLARARPTPPAERL